MCDPVTALDEEAALKRMGIDRRRFAALGLGGVLAACASQPGQADKPLRGITETKVSVATPDGSADALFFTPAKGKHPAVIMWPDIAGLREAYRQMGMRLASAGYAVLVVNHYYRSAPAPILASMAEWRTPEGQAKLAPMIKAINPAATTRDAIAFVAWLDRRREVDRRRGIGTCGYCMGGPYTVRTAAAVSGRIKAAASFHGAGLVTDAPDSPHRLLAQTKARYLFAVARNDDARAPGDKDVLKAAARDAGVDAEIEVYNADHGWCTLDAPVYDKAEAERAWGRMLALFARL